MDKVISKIRNSCADSVNSLFDQLDADFCRTAEESQQAYKDFSVRVLKSVAFRNTLGGGRAGLKFARMAVEVEGGTRLSISDLKDIGYEVYADLICSEESFGQSEFSKNIFSKVSDLLENGFSFVGPCEVFHFEGGAAELLTRRVKVSSSRTFIEQSNIPKKGKNWELKSSEDQWPNDIPIQKDLVIYGTVWNIDCRSSKGNTEQEAVWLANVFLSIIRIGINRVDYCFRAKTGEAESSPFARRVSYSRGIKYNSNVSHWPSGKRITQYRIDKRFCHDLHADSLQKKIDSIFEAKAGSLGERMFQCLGWLSLARQADDFSLRLLYNFTALESLFSNDDGGFTPVADTICRFASVVLTNDHTVRSSVYDEIKNLYKLRSNLVHRGKRTAHWLNSNYIEHVAESCAKVIFQNVDLEIDYVSFLGELRSASHGAAWGELLSQIPPPLLHHPP